MHSRCLKCRYIRDGIGTAEACPECGEPAPERDWIVLHGRSTSAHPGWGLFGGFVLFAAAVAAAITAFRTRQFFLVIQAVFLAGGGCFVGGTGVLLLRRTGDGGDVTWIAKPESLEIRGSLRTVDLPWSSLEWAHFERGFARHLVRLSVTQRGGLDMSSINGIWIDERQFDARRLHDLLRERIAAAAPQPAQEALR